MVVSRLELLARTRRVWVRVRDAEMEPFGLTVMVELATPCWPPEGPEAVHAVAAGWVTVRVAAFEVTVWASEAVPTKRY